MRIETDFVHPPIPTRKFDWSATFRGYEPGDPIGYGETEAQAIQDLKDQIEGMEPSYPGTGFTPPDMQKFDPDGNII